MENKYGVTVTQLKASLDASANTIGLIRVLIRKGVLEEADMKMHKQESKDAMKDLLAVSLATICSHFVINGDLDLTEADEFAETYDYAGYEDLRLQATTVLESAIMEDPGNPDFDATYHLLKTGELKKRE